MIVSPAKTAESIEMPFGLWTCVGPRNDVLHGGAYWRHLTNTIEPSMCGSDAACCQITLITCCLCSYFSLFICYIASIAVHISSCRMCLDWTVCWLRLLILHPVSLRSKTLLPPQHSTPSTAEVARSSSSLSEIQDSSVCSTLNIINR